MKLTKKEIECCYLTWGAIPQDEYFIKNSQLFKDKYKEIFKEDYNIVSRQKLKQVST